MACEAAVQADPGWQEAMRKRGVEDFSLAMIDPWAAGYTGEEDAATARRILRPLTWVRSEPGEHGYARPIEGLVVEFDLDAMAVVAVHDYGVVPLPPKTGNYDARADGRPRQRPALPVAAGRPQADRDHAARRARASPSRATTCAGRSGSCGSASRRARGSCCTTSATRTAAPCGRSSTARRWRRCSSPTATRRRRTASRTSSTWASTASAGSPTRSTLGCDCLGEIRYFDGVVNDQDGEPMTIPNAICMHEEDVGIGWKHTDFRTEDVEVRRLRRLVISSIATVGNYEYGYFWYLYTDGTIEYEVKLSGVISTGALAPSASGPRTARWSPPGCTARTTSTSSACGWTWPSTATPTRSCRSTPSRRRRAGEPDGHRLGDQAHRLWLRGARPRRRSTRCAARYWRIENPSQVVRARRPGRPTSSCRARTSRRCSRRTRASPSAPASRATTCG